MMILASVLPTGGPVTAGRGIPAHSHFSALLYGCSIDKDKVNFTNSKIYGINHKPACLTTDMN
eukprot:2598551-Pleurochrysis_carterae.AAC.2